MIRSAMLGLFAAAAVALPAVAQSSDVQENPSVLRVLLTPFLGAPPAPVGAPAPEVTRTAATSGTVQPTAALATSADATSSSAVAQDAPTGRDGGGSAR